MLSSSHNKNQTLDISAIILYTSLKRKKKYRNYTINYHRGLYYLCGHYRKVDVCGFFLMSCHCAMNAWLLSVQNQDCYQR